MHSVLYYGMIVYFKFGCLPKKQQRLDAKDNTIFEISLF